MTLWSGWKKERRLALHAAVSILSMPAARSACAHSPVEASGAVDVVIRTSIAEASRTFALPDRWIRAVIQAESAFDPQAISPAGAVGLMQVMPATYAELRGRYRLGPDPLNLHDNVFAGTAYLRELYDRFGPKGFLAAYNAGPGRYERSLSGTPLPFETRAYVERILTRLGHVAAEEDPVHAPHPSPRTISPDPVTASIFVVMTSDLARRTPDFPEAQPGLFPTLGPAGPGRE